MGIRKYIVTLTTDERERLTRLVSNGRDKAYRIRQANILLAADENGPSLSSQAIAKVFSCHLNTVSDICQRFVEQGLEAALDRKKRQTPPTPRKLDG
jgi:transposase